jgi:hypothetical protein
MIDIINLLFIAIFSQFSIAFLLMAMYNFIRKMLP